MKNRNENIDQSSFYLEIDDTRRSREDILQDIKNIISWWKNGKLGGEFMPEDVHPDIDKTGDELAIYFTLGMSLNFQRNSYSLWKACTASYNDPETKWIFKVQSVVDSSEEELRKALQKYKVALQPNKHTKIWSDVSSGILMHGNGSVKKIFRDREYDIRKIRDYIQINKKSFPYLNGPKICNYWLFVMLGYMDWPIANREALTVAPDTHVIQASRRLGVISEFDLTRSDVGNIVATRWDEILTGTDLFPIDVHTPLWLWSRSGYATFP